MVSFDMLGENYFGKTIEAYCWIHNIRKMSKFSFLVLRDGKYFLQAFVEDNSLIEDINYEDFVYVTGKLIEQPKSKLGYELILKEIKKIKSCKLKMPFNIWQDFDKFNVKLDTILNHRTIALRNLKLREYIKFQHYLVSCFYNFMVKNGFINIFTPKIVNIGAESGAELFEVNYFKKKAYLAQSPQFYKQHGVSVFGKVFEIGPVFRAEQHYTSFHLNEYISLDAEMICFTLKELMSFVQDLICYIFAELNKKVDPLIVGNINTVEPQQPFFSIKYKDLITMIKKENETILKNSRAIEKFASDLALKETGVPLCFITHFPVYERPFYTKIDDEDKTRTLSFDLIFDGLEIITGSLREEDYNKLVSQAKYFDIDESMLKYYLEPFMCSMPPHGGFGLGAARFLMKYFGLKNVRLTAMYPRDQERLLP